MFRSSSCVLLLVWIIASVECFAPRGSSYPHLPPSKALQQSFTSSTTISQQLKASTSISMKALPITSTSMRSPSTTCVNPKLQTILVLFSVSLLAGYHVNLFRKEFKHSNAASQTETRTWRQYQADTREDWSRYVRESEGWLYAIQALRNAITAQTFLATTVLSLLTLITGKIWDLLRVTTLKSERRLLTVQLTSIAVTMLFSSYEFLQGVRLMTHAGFMFPVKKNGTKVDKIMRKTQNCQWLGLRWMYLSLGPIAWVVGGSRAFFGSAIALSFFFRSIDKEPEGMQYEQFQADNI